MTAMTRKLAPALVLAAGLLVALPLATAAQTPPDPAPVQTTTPTPTPPPDPAPAPAAGVQSLDSGLLAGALTGAFDSWLGGTGQATLLRVLGWLVGQAVHAVRDWLAPLLGVTAGDNLLVTLPADLTTHAPWVRDSWALFRGVATAAVGGGFVLLLLAAGLRGLAWGATWEEVTGAFPAVVAVLVGINASLDAADWLRGLLNAVSLTFVDGAARLPGWDTLSAGQQTAGDGLTAVCFAVLSVFLALGRFVTLEVFNLCVVLAPLACALLLVPGAGRFAGWVFGKGLRAAVVQVPQAIAIGQGAALVAAFGAGAGVLTLGLGVACYWLAARLPAMLPGFDNPGGLPGMGWAKWGLMALSLPAGAAAGVATATEVTRFAGFAGGLGAGATAALPGALEGAYRLLPLAPAQRLLPAPTE